MLVEPTARLNTSHRTNHQENQSTQRSSHLHPNNLLDSSGLGRHAENIPSSSLSFTPLPVILFLFPLYPFALSFTFAFAHSFALVSFSFSFVITFLYLLCVLCFSIAPSFLSMRQCPCRPGPGDPTYHSAQSDVCFCCSYILYTISRASPSRFILRTFSRKCCRNGPTVFCISSVTNRSSSIGLLSPHHQ